MGENTAGSYSFSHPSQRVSTDTQLKSEKTLLPLQSQAHEASQQAASLPATEHGDRNRSVPGVHCLSDSEGRQGPCSLSAVHHCMLMPALWRDN